MISIRCARYDRYYQHCFMALGLLVFQLGFPTAGQLYSASRPNILLIMADDLGYSDLGCYGGEIDTPHIDKLANDGVRFSTFRATPMCTTSRIALLSGMPFHRAGQENYSHSVPLPILLQKAGYRTMMTGKWHAGKPDPRSRELFDRSFGFLGGMTDCFIGGSDWFLDSDPYRDFSRGFYATRAFADRSIEFMRESLEQNKPFFMYVAFNAPHHPCQAPQATVSKYRSKYRLGYAETRRQRYRRQVHLGLVNASWPQSSPEQEVRSWEELTEHRRQVEANRMAAYAAAVDELDHNVGRLIKFLDEANVADNTLVLFLSDNGGDYGNGSIKTDDKQIPWKPGSNVSSSNGWAWVKNTPFRYYKHSCHEGGLAVPLIVNWKDGIKLAGGSILHNPCHITDLYPTFLELAGVRYPASHNGHQLVALTGSSLLPLLKGKALRAALPVFSWYKFSRAWIEDEWKAVSLYNGPWKLFDLTHDRCESHDLAKQQPQLIDELTNNWVHFADASGIKLDQPTETVQKNWGWHRLRMVCPNLLALSPPNGSVTESNNVALKLSLSQPADFHRTTGKKISLWSVSNESEPIWEADPDETFVGQDTLEIVFNDIPQLEYDQHYFVLWESGWLVASGSPIASLNDGAYWWRFRTPSMPSEVLQIEPTPLSTKPVLDSNNDH